MKKLYKVKVSNSESRILRPTGQIVNFASGLGYSKRGLEVKLRKAGFEANLMSALELSGFPMVDGEEIDIVVSGDYQKPEELEKK
jgi:phosphotransferase system HPr-like phosphotransfer protein